MSIPGYPPLGSYGNIVDGPREYSRDEIEDAFIDRIRTLLDYWDRQDGTCHRKMEGLVHSILVILDGGDGSNLPGFVVSPYPHPDDKDFQLEQGENWYPPFLACGTLHLGIAGLLHERWAKTYQDR